MATRKTPDASSQSPKPVRTGNTKPRAKKNPDSVTKPAAPRSAPSGFTLGSAPIASPAPAVAKRKPFPVKIFLLGLAALTAGILVFVLAPGNEPLTFVGFALVLGGLLVPTIVLLRRVLRKIFFWMPASLMAFAVIFPLTLSAYVVFFFPNETVRQIMQTEMSKALKRPVSIGSLRISLLEGITLDKLVISDRDGKSPFVSASLVLSYKLLPILTGNLVVNQAVLESPSITVTRRIIAGKAVLSIDDLLAGGGAPEAVEEQTATETQSGAAPAIPFAISVGEIGLRNGSITIEDQATKGFANRYTLDKLDCLASELTWPMTQPLRVRFAFRMTMEELGAPTNTAKALSIHPGIEGRMVLKKSGGTLVPEGRIEFFANNGLFHGQQFLTKSQDFLDTLKADFFRGIQREAEKRLDQFESDLKAMVSKFSGEATKRIDTIIADAQKKFASVTNELARAGGDAVREFDTSVTSAVTSIDAEVKKLEDEVNAAFSSINRLYPAARTKLKLETYTSQAKAKAETAKKEYAAFGKGLSEGLAKDIAKIIEGERQRFTDWSKSVKNSLDAQITKYAASVRNEFRKQLANVRSFVDSFELDIPFLRKRMEFDEARTGLDITNGVMVFKGLSIGGKEFLVQADGSYGILDGSITAHLRLSLDKRHAANPLIGIFAAADGRPELGLSIKTVQGNLVFSLDGPPLFERMKSLAADKAQEYIRNYLAQHVTMDAFLSRIGGGNAVTADSGKVAITAAKNSRNTALQNEKARRARMLADESRAIKKKMEDDAKKSVASVLPGGLKKPF